MWREDYRHCRKRLWILHINEHPNVRLTVFMGDDFVWKIAQYVKLGDLMGWKMDSGKVERATC